METPTRPPEGGELDRVTEQVEDDLANTPLVSLHQVDGGVEREHELHAVFGGPLPDHDHAALERLTQREEVALELHLPCLHLGQVEDVVDQSEQVVGRGEDVVQVLVLLLVHLAEQLLLQHL